MSAKIKYVIPASIVTILLILSVYIASRRTMGPQTGDSAASGPVVLTDEQGEYPLGLYMNILEDPSGELTIKDVSSSVFDSRFIPSQVETPNYGGTESAYWVRLNLNNKTSLTDQWLLEIEYPNMQYVELFSPLPNEEGFTVKETGSLQPPETRDILYPRILFSLVIPTQSQQTIYLRFKSGASMTLPLTLWDKNTFINKSIPKDGLLVVFYGVLLGLLVYNIFLLFSIREASYLYLVLFLASFAFFLASYDGYIEVYLLPKLYYLKTYYHWLPFSIIFISTILFANTVLELKTLLHFFYRMMIILLAVWGILALLVPFTSYFFIGRIMVIWAIFTSILLLIAGVMLWKQGYTPVRYYLIAWFGFLVSITLILLVRLGFATSNYFTENAFRVGLVWVALGWSLVLADRVNLLKNETEVANRSLRNNENRLSQILEGMPLGVVVYGKDQKPTYLNHRTLDILSNPTQGIQPSIEAGRSLVQAMEYFSFQIAGTNERYPLENIPVYTALNGKAASVDDVEVNIGDRQVPLEIWASPIKDETGNVESAVVVFEDISQRRQTEAELVQYRKHLETLVEIRTAQLERVNRNLELGLEWQSRLNKAHQGIAGEASLASAYDLLSARIQQILGATLVFILRWDEQSKVTYCALQANFDPDAKIITASFQTDTLLQQDINQGKIVTLPTERIALLSASLGEYFHKHDIEFSILAPLMIRPPAIGVLGVAVKKPLEDFISQQVHLVERMATDLANLTQDAVVLDHALLQAAVDERDRLARDLHDSVTQALFSASLLAEVLPRIWRRDPEQGFQKLENLRQLTRGALAEMRTLLIELRPASVINTPLSDLLAQMTDAVMSRSNLSFQLSIERTPILPEQVQINFYRIAQEALNNVVKHAQAEEIMLSLSATPLTLDSTDMPIFEINLRIRDDGVGYSFMNNQSTTHLGGKIMQERAEAIQASLSVESQLGRGTQITLIWRGEIKGE